MTRTRGKRSSAAETPPGAANSVQGQCVLGLASAEAASHPTLTYVTR